ncbi:Mu transposase domain-containing protein [Pseudonocardia xishanensis]|uniref:Transposase for insertion sequence element IS21-like C-terminal domain-containing protein n=1 Tax=Pseudonocardia xishanensis TaxID=630995 RepID=A0ABP8S391_9PSEU
MWDNESAIGSWRGGRPQLTDARNSFRGALGIRVVQCKPGDLRPQAWSSAATAIWRPRSCPGATSPHRRISTPSSGSGWPGRTPANTADSGVARSTGGRPITATCSSCHLWALVGWAHSPWLPRDHYVRLDANDYTVQPCAVGRRVTVTADLDYVLVSWDGRRVARHRRCWARHQTLTDPAHAAAAAMRAARSEQFQRSSSPRGLEVEQRALADYDRILGLDESSDGLGEKMSA